MKTDTNSSTPSRLTPARVDELAARVLRAIKLPPGTDAEDAMQDARLAILRREQDGFTTARLYVRVWGDLKDQYGREWRDLYRMRGTEGNANVPRRACKMTATYRAPCDSETHPSSDNLDVPPRSVPSSIGLVDWDVQGEEVDPGVSLDVREAISKLTPDQKQVMTLIYLEGKSPRMVAALRGVSVHAVRLMTMRARAALAELLVAYDPAGRDD